GPDFKRFNWFGDFFTGSFAGMTLRNGSPCGCAAKIAKHAVPAGVLRLTPVQLPDLGSMIVWMAGSSPAMTVGA
ncbi:MAG: hypothetical protein ACLPWS_19735, partial [Rhodomicrobium sp.]